MTFSSIMANYLGEGLLASRPAAPNISPSTLGLYYATDVSTLYTWTGAAWTAFAGAGTVTSVASGTGLTGGPVTTTGTLSLAAIASHDVLANITGGSAAPVANTVSDVLDAAIGNTQGDILYRGASGWSVLVPGVAGQFLQSQGASANPVWDTVADIGRNKLLNSLFLIAQRGAGPFTSTAYGLDQWILFPTTDTMSITQAAMSDADRTAVGDEEATVCMQNVFVGNAAAGAFNQVQQRIENAPRLSNRTVTLSFWAKAASGTPKLGASLDQNFGSGGSAAVQGNGSSVTLSTSYARYSMSFTLGSTNGKTVGANGFTQLNIWYSSGATNNTRAGSVGVQSGTVSIWGVQLEIGTLTPLEKLNPREHLANCQRYYLVQNYQQQGAAIAGNGFSSLVSYPVTMRVAPIVALTSTTSTNVSSIGSVPFVSGANIFGVATAAGQVTIAGNFTASAEL